MVAHLEVGLEVGMADRMVVLVVVVVAGVRSTSPTFVAIPSDIC